MDYSEKSRFADELKANLTDNILPYWLDKMIDPEGGFFGRRDGFDRLQPDAPKGAILNARILWTFAAAYRTLGKPEYLEAATRAKQYITDHFIDKEYGGVYWSLNADGTPLDTHKQFYAIAFTIYGLSEYTRATNDRESLDTAIALFNSIETHSRDRKRGGYLEATTRQWLPIDDMRLSDKDDNASKTMNTHLHILEAYANLLRVCDHADVREATASLLTTFIDHIADPRTKHLGLFFDDNWDRVDQQISYGHDIEASWLLLEAATLVKDPDLISRTMSLTRAIAMAALEGRCFDGSMIYERHGNGHYDNDKHWWVQAENVVGQIYIAKFHGMERYYEMARESWEYIKQSLVDPNGEWYWSRLAYDNSINRADDKAGFWKCPYHNSRMCLESIQLLLD